MAAACGSPDFQDGDPCDKNGQCPTGFTCEPVSQRCFRNNINQIDAGGGAMDARQIDAPPVALDTTLTKSPPARTKDTMVSFEFTGTPAGATFECKIDDGAFAACTSPRAVTAAEGAHVFTVAAVSGADRDGTPATASWTVDTTAPVAKIESGPSVVSGASAAFTYSAEAGAKFECAFGTSDSAAFASCPTTGVTYDNLTNGQTYTFRVRALDDVGNASAPVVRTFAADSVAPGVIISSPAPNDVTGGTVSPLFAANPLEAGVVFECSTGGGFVACTSGAPLILPEGTVTLSVRGRDLAGNVGQPASVTFTVNTTAATVSISSPLPNALTKATLQVTFVSANATSFTCTLDGAPVTPCSAAGASIGPLTDKKHTFTVVAHGGGSDSPPASVTFTSDGTPPAVGSTVMMNADNTGTAVLQITSTETLVGLLATADGVPCTVNATFTLATCNTLGPGQHTFVAIGTDAAGNASQPSATLVSMAYGPSAGNLVLIGHGFRTPSAATTAMIGNALTLAPATKLANFNRPLRLAFYARATVNATEKANVQAAIADGLMQHDLSYDPEDSVEFGATAGDELLLAQKLVGRDALVIYNQGANPSPLDAVALAFSTPLQDFLNKGGLVIITDGWFGVNVKTPSQSYRVVPRSILDVANATTYTGNVILEPFMKAGSVDADPIAATVAQSYVAGSADPAIHYTMQDLYIAPIFVDSLTCGGMCGLPVVLRKIFSRPARGPVHVTVSSLLDGPMAAKVVFHKKDGTPAATVDTNSLGVAVGSLDDKGFVTVAFDLENANRPTHIAETVAGARPYDHLQLGLNFDPKSNSGNDPAPLGHLNLKLPDTTPVTSPAGTATKYTARVICTSTGSEVSVTDGSQCGDAWEGPLCTTPGNTGTWSLPYYGDCFDLTGKVAVLLVAYDASGNQVGAQFLTGLKTTADPAGTAASWAGYTSGSNYLITLTNPPAGTGEVKTGTFFRLGTAFVGGDSRVFGVPFDGPAQAGFFNLNGSDGPGDMTIATFGENDASVVLHLNFSPSASGRSISLSGALLDHVVFGVGSGVRPTVSFSPAQPDADGAVAMLTWSKVNAQQVPIEDYFWGFVFSPSAATVTAPILPAELSGYSPGAPMTTAVTLQGGVVVDSSLTTGFDDWRQSYWFPSALNRFETLQYDFFATGNGKVNLFLPFAD